MMHPKMKQVKRQFLVMSLGIALACGGAVCGAQDRPDNYAVSCDPGGCSGTGGSILDSAPPQDDAVITCDPGGCSGTGGAR